MIMSIHAFLVGLRVCEAMCVSECRECMGIWMYKSVRVWEYESMSVKSVWVCSVWVSGVRRVSVWVSDT